jgi:LCP family protein required for cell wall assembly
MAQTPFRRSKPADDAPLPPPDPIDRPIGVVPVEGPRARKRRRTWPQRTVLAFNTTVSFSLIAGAAGVWYANHQLGNRKLVDISSSAIPPDPANSVVISTPNVDPATGGPLPTGAPTVPLGPGETAPVTAPPTTVPAKSLAKNFLLTASDSRDCIDPDSPYAGAFGNVDGERADTIMLLRVDPESNQAAILSFPRDLWVKIPGRGNSRINAALDKTNPQKIIDTIAQNFYLAVDHYINVDFCAFKGLVEAVDGVPVPFEFAARDKNTGLYIDAPGCWTLKGDEALAYVRSRKYQYQDANGNWKSDGTSDLGRISRQQDFLKRTLTKALNNGARSPLVAKRLMDTALEYLTVDRNLNIDAMLELATAMRDFDANTLKSFQIDASDMKVGDASVLKPQINNPNMKAVLSVFRGQASILDIPKGLDPSLATTSTTIGLATTVTTLATGGASTTTTAPPPSVVAVTENTRGIFPPNDPSCK